jgi:hypothetical protein
MRPGSCPRGPPVECLFRHSSPGLPVLMSESVAYMPSPLPRWNHLVLVIRGHRASFATRRQRPSPLRRWVGFHLICFGASMAFHLCSGLLARGTAKQPFPSRASAGWFPARLSRLLPGAMTISRAGLSPARLQHPSSRRTTQLVFIEKTSCVPVPFLLFLH